MKKIFSFPFIREGVACFFLAPVLGLIALSEGVILPLVAGVLQWIAFLALGAGHVFLFRRRLESLQKEHLLFSPLGWTVTIALALEIFILLALLYAFMPGDRLVYSGVSCSAFLLAYIVAEAWEIFYAIPDREYKIWFNPESMDPFSLAQTSKLPVRLKVRRRYFDIREELFPLTVPARLKVGRFFYHFILDEEKKGAPGIEKEDEDRNAYGWQFYSEDLGGVIRKFLDPQRTLEENKIRKNSIIVARRVRVENKS